MKIYWTLQIPDLPREVGFGSPVEFIRWLNSKNLRHSASADWIIDLLGHEEPDGTTIYTHEHSGKPVWTLSWGRPQVGVHDNTV
jgi:hypothetical protein